MFERNAKNGSWGEFDGFTPKKKNCDICLTRNKRACSLQSNVPPLTAVCPLPWEPLESLYTTGPPPSRKAAGQNIYGKNNRKKGGTPLPHQEKRPAKKLTEKKSRKRGVPPPPSRTFSVTGVFELFPYQFS